MCLWLVWTLRCPGSSELGNVVVMWRCLELQRAPVWECGLVVGKAVVTREEKQKPIMENSSGGRSQLKRPRQN